MTRFTSNNVHNQWIHDAIEKYQSSLIAYATRLLSNRESAKDVVQEAFLQLCRQNREKVGEYLSPWLYRVVRNRALNFIRKEKRMVQPLLPEQFAASPSSESDQTVTSGLFELIRSLPEKQSELLMLKFADGFSYKEISQITGMSVSNVGYVLHHALKELKSRWEILENPNN